MTHFNQSVFLLVGTRASDVFAISGIAFRAAIDADLDVVTHGNRR